MADHELVAIKGDPGVFQLLVLDDHLPVLDEEAIGNPTGKGEPVGFLIKGAQAQRPAAPPPQVRRSETVERHLQG
ncbi:hypothetical protein D3C73_596340 [compost metagenome]